MNLVEKLQANGGGGREFAPVPARREDNAPPSPSTSPKVRKDFPETWIWTEKLISAK